MKPLFMLLVLFASAAQAQQDPLYAQYLLNPLVINPAYAGLNNNMNMMAGYRTQWTGLEGHPETLNVSANTSIVNDKAGAGFLLVHDRVGNTTTTEINASFAYKLKLQEAIFSFGMQAGVQKFKTDYSDFTIFDSDDPAFINNAGVTRLNLGAGAILKSERYMVGLSVPRLLPSTFSDGGQEFTLYDRHLYLFGAYVFYLNERVRFKPATLLRAVNGAPASVDLAMNFNFNSIHTAGVFTRNFNAYGILLQTLLADKYRFGYVFELPATGAVGTKFTTHEVSLGILLSAFSFHDRSISNF